MYHKYAKVEWYKYIFKLKITKNFIVSSMCWLKIINYTLEKKSKPGTYGEIVIINSRSSFEH